MNRAKGPRFRRPPSFLLRRASIAGRLVLLFLVAGVLGACGSDSGGPSAPEEPVYRVAVSLDSLIQIPEDVDTLSATATRDGVTTAEPVAWSSSSPGVVSVTDGVVTAASVGQAFVIARVGTGADSTRVTVTEGRAAEEVVVADSTELDLVSDSAEMAEGTLRFRKQGGGDVQLRPGDILAGAESGGFLRLIDQVEDEGGEVVVRTSEASLEEAIEAGEFDEGQTLAMSAISAVSAGSPAYPASLPTQIELAPGASLGPDGRIQLKGIRLGKRTRGSAGGDLDIDVDITNGFIDFQPRATLNAKFKWLKGLRRFRASAGGQLSWNADVDVHIRGDVNASVTHLPKFGDRIAYFSWGPYVTTVGGVPVVYRWILHFRTYVSTTASFEGTFHGHFDGNPAVEFGARWHHRDGWQGIASRSGGANSEVMVGDVGGEIYTRFGIVPELELRIYEAVGGLAGVDGNVLLGAGVNNLSWFASAQVFVDAYAGGQVKIASKRLARYTYDWRLFASPEWKLEGGLYTLSVTPQNPSIPIGGSVDVDARAANAVTGLPTALPGNVVWSIDDPNVATIDQSGVIRGVSAGRTGFTARISKGGGQIQARGTVEVSADPPGIRLSQNSAGGTHTIGVTGCPQVLAIVTVTNTGSVPLDLSTSSIDEFVEDFIETSFGQSTLGPGESTTMEVRFNCMTTTSFSGPLVVRGTATDGSGSTATAEMTVTMNIQEAG